MLEPLLAIVSIGLAFIGIRMVRRLSGASGEIRFSIAGVVACGVVFFWTLYLSNTLPWAEEATVFIIIVSGYFILAATHSLYHFRGHDAYILFIIAMFIVASGKLIADGDLLNAEILASICMALSDFLAALHARHMVKKGYKEAIFLEGGLVFQGVFILTYPTVSSEAHFIAAYVIAVILAIFLAHGYFLIVKARSVKLSSNRESGLAKAHRSA